MRTRFISPVRFRKDNGIIRIRKKNILVFWPVGTVLNIKLKGKLSQTIGGCVMTSCCMWTSCSSLPTEPCCPSVHGGGKISNQMALNLFWTWINPPSLSLLYIQVSPYNTEQNVFCLLMIYSFFAGLSLWLQTSTVLNQVKRFVMGENLSTNLSYSWHRRLLPACLTRTCCNERLMLNSEQKMKLQGNKHEWVSGKAIWLKESVEENRQSNINPALLFPSRSSIKGTFSGQKLNF